MHKFFNKALLLVVSICSLHVLCSAVEAKTTTHLDIIRLQKASDLINSKQYLHGYASFKTMAKKGCPYSQCIIGIMRQNGTGVKQNAMQAKYWFSKAAKQGFTDAETRLGLMYYRGDGIKKNLVLARQWLSRAASHGVIEAQQLLAQIPGEAKVATKFSQAPQQVVGTASNIQKSWQGYSEVSKQLSLLSSASQAQ
jgi:TPR repeat protein